jgi:hypothetical protein
MESLFTSPHYDFDPNANYANKPDRLRLNSKYPAATVLSGTRTILHAAIASPAADVLLVSSSATS